jgi:hypothetical protein
VGSIYDAVVATADFYNPRMEESLIIPKVVPTSLGVDLGGNIVFCDPTGTISFDWNRQVSIGDIKLPEIQQLHAWLVSLANPYIAITYEVPFSPAASANYLMAMYQATLLSALQTAPVVVVSVSKSQAASARVALGIRGKGTDTRNTRKCRVVEAMFPFLPVNVQPDALAFIAYVRNTPLPDQTKDIPARFKSVTDYADACVMAHYGQMPKTKAPTKKRKPSCKSKEENTAKPSMSQSRPAAARPTASSAR